MPKPIAVITGDVHFSLNTLDLATQGFQQALKHAETLGVPLISNGDTLDTKAVIRAEVANRVIQLLTDTKVEVIINTGNHDLINEKGKESALNFLRPYATVVSSPVSLRDMWFMPYFSDPEQFEEALSRIPNESTVICHQGVTKAEPGEYTHDKSAVSAELFAEYRTIGSHYHRAQSIKCGRPRKGAIGLFSYIGNLYSLTFAEANDGPKGFQVLYSDGTLEHIPTNLRKHVVIDCVADQGTLFRQSSPGGPDYGTAAPQINPGDLVWIKVKGTALELDKLSKDDIKSVLSLRNTAFKLDKIVIDAPLSIKADKAKTNSELMDQLIEESKESVADKKALMYLYREVMS